MSKSIVLIRFSNRQNGNCKGISDVIQDYYRDHTVQTFTIDANTMPACSNCDYECLAPEKVCPNITPAQSQIYKSICNADLTYMIIPNYCGYPCANYFAYNERSVGYFNLDRALMGKYTNAKKRFIIVSNTEGPNFENALKQQSSKPEILYLKTGKYGRRSTAGDLMESKDGKADLMAFLGSDGLV